MKRLMLEPITGMLLTQQSSPRSTKQSSKFWFCPSAVLPVWKPPRWSKAADIPAFCYFWQLSLGRSRRWKMWLSKPAYQRITLHNFSKCHAWRRCRKSYQLFQKSVQTYQVIEYSKYTPDNWLGRAEWMILVYDGHWMICTTSLDSSLYSIGRFPSHLWMRYGWPQCGGDKDQLCTFHL